MADFGLVARATTIQRQQLASSYRDPIQRDQPVPATLHEGLIDEEQALRAQ